MKKVLLSVSLLSLVVGCSDAVSKKSDDKGENSAKAGVEVTPVADTDIIVVPVKEEILVDYELPHISEAEKIDSKTPLAYIYVGSPATEKLREMYGTAIRLQFEGSFKKTSDIPAFIEGKIRHLNDVDRAKMCVCLKIDKDVKCGVVRDIETELRRAGVFKICYASISDFSFGYGDAGLVRVLPPMADENVNQDVKVKERNLLLVFVSGSGSIMAGGKVIQLDALKDKAKEFILNATDDKNLPEKKPTDIEMPDGSKWTYPVSEGVISLQNTRDTSYERYIEVQNELTRAFNEVRDELSMTKFGKKFKDLDEAEYKVITKAIPMKISEAEPRRMIK